MNICKTLLISGMALAMTAGLEATAQEALPSVNADNGKVKVTDQKEEETQPETWKSLGTGLYRDNLMHTFRLMGDWYPEWEVEIMESEKTPGYYKVVGAYKNSPYSGWGQANNDPAWCIFINAEDPDGVYIPDWYAGFDFTDPDNEQVGPFMIWTQAHDYLENEYGDLVLAKEEGLCGHLKNGAITFPPGAMLVQIAPDYEYHNEQWHVSNKQGKWRVKLPGAPDLDISFTYSFSTDGTAGKVTTFLEVDKDVQKVLGAIVNSTDAETIYEAIVAGEIETQEFTQSGTYTFDVPKNGQYTVMMVPYYKDEALEPVFGQGEFIVADNDWVSCKELGTWSDGFFYGIEQDFLKWYPSNDNKVEVQYSTKEQGTFRLVDPFGPNSYEFSQNYDSSKKHYMVFHVTDNNVTMDHMNPAGLNLGYGPIEVWCKAERQRELEKTEEEIAQWYGKLDGNTITFPKGGLLTKFPVVYPHWYGANYYETFNVKLPDEALQGMTGVDMIEAAGEVGGVAYYNLQGMRVDGSSLAPGIYIKVANGKTSKFIVK